MEKQPVGQLPDLTQSNNDDEIMVITDSEYNQLKKEKISDLITDFTSTDENNALTKGTDGKMFVTDFGNASNITEGTLPTSVLPEIPLEKIPDIPKDKLPPIETSDLPVSGVSADTYAYPSSVTVNSQGQVTAIKAGEPGANNANQDLSNISEAGKEVIRETAGSDYHLTQNQITNCILEAPNGVATYSDNTITVKQGLKVLFPNGRNADGSLKNIEYVLSADTSFNAAVESLTSYTRNIIIFLQSNNMKVSSLSDNIPLYYQETQPSKFFAGFAYWYNTAENKVYYSEGNSVFTEALAIIIGSYTINSSAITALRTDKAVSLAKWSDIEYTSRHIVTKYYRNGTSWYRLWSDGFLEQGGIGPITGAIQLIKAYSDTNYSKLLTSRTTGGAIYCAVVESAGATTTSSFKVVGSTTQTTWWYTTGYAG